MLDGDTKLPAPIAEVIRNQSGAGCAPLPERRKFIAVRNRKERDGGRTRDRTLDLSRVKGPPRGCVGDFFRNDCPAKITSVQPL